MDEMKCPYCVAEGDMIGVGTTPHGQWFVACRNCAAETPYYGSELMAREEWKNGNATIPVQSEKKIYKACLALMDGPVEDFIEYLDFMDVDRDEDTLARFSRTPFEIVQTLFLRGTTHGGGTSTRAKMRELGIDTADIYFGEEYDEE